MFRISAFAEDGSDWIWTELDLRIKQQFAIKVSIIATNRFPTVFRNTTWLRTGNTKNEIYQIFKNHAELPKLGLKAVFLRAEPSPSALVDIIMLKNDLP